MVLAGDLSSVLIEAGDADLDTGVICGLDQAAGRAALSWHVKVDEFSAVVLHFDDWRELTVG